MKLRSTLFTSALGAFVALASCSDDSSKKVPFGTGEAGEAGAPAEGGTGGKGGSGGRSGSPGAAGMETGGMDPGHGPDLTGGAAGAAPIDTAGTTGGGPAPALLFTVAADAVGIGSDAVASSDRRASTLFGSIDANPNPRTGSDEVRMTSAELGLAVGDALSSFAVVQPVAAHPLYWFSVGPNEGGEGQPTTRLSYSSNANEALGDVYFSDATESYHSLGEGSDTIGYNALVADEQSLGLSPDTTRSGPTHEDNLTGVGALPSGLTPRELYFTVGPNSVGVAGSGVEATPANERACTIFHSTLSGTNTAVYHCSDLGLLPGSQITGLVLYGATVPSDVLFTLASGSQGVTESGVASAAAITSTIFESPLDGTNSLKVEGHALGLYPSDSLDALAVVDQAPASYSFADSCALSVVPTSSDGPNLAYINSVRELGRDFVLFQGPIAGSTTLDGIGVYQLSTCELVVSTTLPTGTLNGNYWAPIPGDNWSAATPLTALELFQLADDATSVKRYDITGKLLDTYGLGSIEAQTMDATTLDYDEVHDGFYAVVNAHSSDGNYTRIAFPHPSSGRPDGTVLVTTVTPLPHPCAYNPALSGVDDDGNSIYAQLDNTGLYRVCSFSSTGEFADIPFLWQLQQPADLAVLKPGTALFAISVGEGVGISRYTLPVTR